MRQLFVYKTKRRLRAGGFHSLGLSSGIRRSVIRKPIVSSMTTISPLPTALPSINKSTFFARGP